MSVKELRIVVIGKRGSGTSTHAELLARVTGLPHVSLEAELFSHPDFEKPAIEALLGDEGIVGDKDIARIAGALLKRFGKERGFVMDAFPMTPTQAIDLDYSFSGLCVVYLTASERELEERQKSQTRGLWHLFRRALPDKTEHARTYFERRGNVTLVEVETSGAVHEVHREIREAIGIPKYVVGLAGPRGAGKGTAAEFIMNHATSRGLTCESATSSGILLQTLELWGLEPTGEHLQDLFGVMSDRFGEDVLANAVYHRLDKLIASAVIFDGVRRMADVEMLRREPDNLIIYIDADVEERWRRTHGRGEKPGEKTTTLKDFKERESVKSEQELADVREVADVVIRNNGTLEELRAEIEEAVSAFISP